MQKREKFPPTLGKNSALYIAKSPIWHKLHSHIEIGPFLLYVIYKVYWILYSHMTKKMERKKQVSCTFVQIFAGYFLFGALTPTSNSYQKWRKKNDYFFGDHEWERIEKKSIPRRKGATAIAIGNDNARFCRQNDRQKATTRSLYAAREQKKAHVEEKE